MPCSVVSDLGLHCLLRMSVPILRLCMVYVVFLLYVILPFVLILNDKYISFIHVHVRSI